MNPAEKKRFSNRRILFSLSIVFFLAYSLMSQFFFLAPLLSMTKAKAKDNQNEFTFYNRQETNQSENVDVHRFTLNGTTVQEKTNQTENGFENISAVGAAGIVRLEEEGCQRRCHPDWAHRNIILYDYPATGAGLKDRLTIISSLALLAGHLCAIVYFPPPYKMVSFSKIISCYICLLNLSLIQRLSCLSLKFLIKKAGRLS